MFAASQQIPGPGWADEGLSIYRFFAAERSLRSMYSAPLLLDSFYFMHTLTCRFPWWQPEEHLQSKPIARCASRLLQIIRNKTLFFQIFNI